MTIPTAVSPSVLTPGLYLSINLLAGPPTPGTGVLRILLVSPKATGGTLTVDTEVREGGGKDSAGVAYGVGSPGHLAAKQLYAEFPEAQIDFCAPTAGAGTATKNFVLSGAPAANTKFMVSIAGRVFEVPWLFGESLDTIRDRVIAYILARTTDLPVTATSGGSATVTVNFKVLGNLGNDCKIYAWFPDGQTGTEAITNNTPTSLAGGTTDPDITNVLDAAQGIEYHLIVLCLSNTDAETTGSTSNAERALLHIEGFNSGLDAKLQQIIYATTGTRANARLAAIARNVGYCEQVNGLNFLSLPCEIAAAEAGQRLSWTSKDPACNRIGNQLGGKGEVLYGSATVTADKPTQPDLEADMSAGVTPLTYDASENIRLVRPITCYSQDATGAPDRRLLDVQNVDATYIIARDLRVALPTEFPNAKIQKDSAPGEDPPPEGVVEERDVKAFVIERLRWWQNRGTILKSELDTVIENGELIVQVNESDATQVDLVLPWKIVPPLAKFGLVINRVPS